MERPTHTKQDEHDKLLDDLVDTRQISYTEARAEANRILGGDDFQPADDPLDGEGSLTTRQAADVLKWYRERKGLGRSAVRITLDKLITTVDDEPLLTLKESAAAMDYLLDTEEK